MNEPTELHFADDLRQSTIDFLWRQWHTVGATTTGGAPTRAIIDPEALILMSLWMMEYERRLADLVTSWVHHNSALISIQRLGNLRSELPPIVARRLAGLAAQRTDEAKDIRWRSLRMDDAEDLGPRGNKIRAVTPRLTSWATLMIQLRMGMGVGAKADVLTFVLGLNLHPLEWASVATIADAVGYTPAAVRRVADDLAGARFIRALETANSDQGTRMFSGTPATWAGTLGISHVTPGWGYWRERYRFIIDVLSWHDRERNDPTTAYARDVAAREILLRHRTALRKDWITEPLDAQGAELNLQYLESASRALVVFWKNQG